MKKLSLLILFALLLGSCNKNLCPENRNIGTQDLDVATTSLVPYSGPVSVQYKNKEGDTITLSSAGTVIGREEMCTKVVCKELLKYGGGVSCETVSCEHRSIIMKKSDNTMHVELAYFFDILTSDSMSLYEQMRISVSTTNASGSGYYLTKNHTLSTIDITKGGVNQALQILPSLVRNGKTYTQVYTNSGYDDTIVFYFTQDDGIIGWDTDGQEWTIIQ